MKTNLYTQLKYMKSTNGQSTAYNLLVKEKSPESPRIHIYFDNTQNIARKVTWEEYVRLTNKQMDLFDGSLTR